MKFILEDFIRLIKKIYRYFYWNIKGVRISFLSDVSINATIDKGCFFTGTSQISSFSTIGAYTYGRNVNIHRAKIGCYCSLGPDVKIGLDEHPLDRESTHPRFYGEVPQKSVIVEDHVWIGANAIVLNGVRIGEHSVIAAGAVVTKDVEPYTIYAGVPARLIKKRK
ncbi:MULTISPECIES: CatB-related O-acetyltransferase [Flavobacterium]|uniref:CatB-related O-acetyltransferase n=1 Tax=Flavobacterium TaxID=237 RepID=UPI001FCAE448|nr:MULTISPECIES: CatB-related O-acetyltransferase [Flavobacterium]UOK43163.1 CatB-related O-acetyltransferase [Flavobacterium enshiense]